MAALPCLYQRKHLLGYATRLVVREAYAVRVDAPVTIGRRDVDAVARSRDIDPTPWLAREGDRRTTVDGGLLRV
jgi:hypothetical protein